MSEIYSIVYKPEKLPTKPLDRYTRVPLESARLVEGHGIEGDRKGKHPKRQLNIMSYETLMELGGEGFQVEPGQMGEQIIVKGLDVNVLEPGDRIQFGEDAVVEVVEHRRGCDRFEALQGKLRSEAAGRMGVIARVVQDGEIRVGDSIRTLEHV